MSFYLGLNRRTPGDRRVLDHGGNLDRRAGERRRVGSDRYVLVLGDAGVDRFGLMVGFPVALLIASALISAFA
jgi:hypothetical protein